LRSINVSEEIRRAKLQDLGEITRLARNASPSRGHVSEPEVTQWLYSKGIWVAIRDGMLVGVAAWQAENLLAVTDVLHVAPDKYWLETGSQLLDTIEGEAQTLMCEANVVLLPAVAPEAARALLQQQGYERRTWEELHGIWQEVLSDLAGDEVELMVKQLRDRMVMVPL
jgi:N-acetylglutamate synthase-like GNAT family acetyltransferase